MKDNEVRVFHIDKTKKQHCKLKGTNENLAIIEIKVLKSKVTSDIDVTTEWTMVGSPATKLIGSNGYLQWVGVKSANQHCGIAKILTRSKSSSPVIFFI